jgi:hypothetical protein
VVAELWQAMGRARSILPEGIPCYVVTTECLVEDPFDNNGSRFSRIVDRPLEPLTDGQVEILSALRDERGYRMCRTAAEIVQALVAEQLSHPTRKTHGSPRCGRCHFVGTPQQVVEALLVQSLLELVVRGPAVMNHRAVVVQSQDVLGHGTAARQVDDVCGSLRTDQRMQPGRVSSDPPAGFIGHHPVGLTHGLADGLIDRLAASSGSQNSVDAAAATETDTKQTLQAARDFTVRQATLFIQLDDGRLSIRSQLGRGSTEGIGCLQGMASLRATLALTAVADMNAELPVNGLAWDLHLKLLGDVSFVEWAAAVGANVGQGRLVNLVDLFGAGRLAVGLGTVILAGFAAWLFGIGLRIAFGEGAGLAFAGTESRIDPHILTLIR